MAEELKKGDIVIPVIWQGETISELKIQELDPFKYKVLEIKYSNDDFTSDNTEIVCSKLTGPEEKRTLKQTELLFFSEDATGIEEDDFKKILKINVKRILPASQANEFSPINSI